MYRINIFGNPPARTTEVVRSGGLSGICDDAHHGFFNFFVFREKRYGVVVTLGHFSSIRPRYNSHIFHNHRLWQFKCLISFAINTIEFFGCVSRNFYVLFLVSSDGHYVCVIKQNIRRHQHWIIKGADIYFFVLGFSVLKSVGPHQVRHGGNGIKNPTKLRMLGNIGLFKQGDLFRIKPQCQIIKHNPYNIFLHFFGTLNRLQGMIVNYKRIYIIFFLHAEKLFHHAEIVADMRPA